METLTLRQAAELCGVSVKAMRNRADRGSIQTVLQGGERRVPRSELERAGLVPDAELRQLREEVSRLRSELAGQRRLVESTEKAAEAERVARERAELAVVEQRAEAAAAQARERQAIAVAQDLEGLEAAMAAAGPVRAWKLARARRRARASSGVLGRPKVAV